VLLNDGDILHNLTVSIAYFEVNCTEAIILVNLFRVIFSPEKYSMDDRKIKREIVASVMESRLYFTIPLWERLQFIKFFSQQSVFNAISNPKIHQANRRDIQP
jgi:hypothetical protein